VLSVGLDLSRTRLESDPGLASVARVLGKLPNGELRRVAVAACETGVRLGGIRDPVVAKVVKHLAAGTKVPAPLKRSLKKVAEDADNRYLDVLEEENGCSSQRCLGAFREARVLAGIVFALGADPLEAAMEAVYEIAIGTDRSEEVLSAISAK
jgi:hypothetical protein